MPIRATRKKTEYAIPREDLYLAVCADVTEPIQEPDRRNPGESKETITVHWLLDEDNPKTSRPFEVQRKFNLTMFAGKSGSGGSQLYQAIKSWLGTNMSQEEADNFDIESLLGVACQLQVIHVITDDGRTFANIGGIFPLKAGMTAPKIPDGYTRRKDRE